MYMVQSKQNKQVNYNETKEIEPHDKNTEVSVYDLVFNRIDGDEYNVVFGKQNNSFMHKKIVYFPIYLVVNDKCHSQIGVIEFSLQDLPAVIDEDGEIDVVDENNIIYYSFVTHEYLQTALHGENKNKEEDQSTTQDENENNESKSDNDEKGINDDAIKKVTNELEEIHLDDSVFDVCLKEPIVDDVSIFEESKFKPSVPYLPEENKSDNDKIRAEYSPSHNENWIEKFMENNHYKIHDNEGGGDSLFIALRDAFEQMGKITSIDLLRSVVQDETSEQEYKTKRDTYLEMEESLRDLSKNIKQNEGAFNEYKKRIKESNLPSNQREELISSAKQIKDNIKHLKSEKERKQLFINEEFGFMQKLDSFDKYKDYLMTSSYGANPHVISILEYKLNIKIILLSEKAFHDGDKDHVLVCGDIYEKTKSSGIFNPCPYIIISNHQRKFHLVSYKDKKTLAYREIPYAIKMLIINKCCEKNSGAFNLIPDFKSLKEKMNISDTLSDQEEDMSLDVYNPNIVFQFYEKSQNKIKPGKGAGEKIDLNKLIDFEKLHKIDNWRRKLHDDYNVIFELENHQWYSVTHYYQASKYKKTHPQYYIQFSLDSKSDISKSIDLAKQKGSMKGQDEKVKIDPDFYTRNLDERLLALTAKFNTPDMKNMLKLTYPAKLVQFKRGYPPEIDKQLLKLRKDLLDS